ncbi:PH domain-containing protein [Streptomyces spiramenti]|uniref:PH domain-containing protein n=1 Tax=Streptomyces spiramenti TaxID=2720606 RepID=A0ABX1APR8_9ACTN|nr:PH domain-containing protein [Streptomyces spiramenti]NJP68290.1 PH domain-containing protein [Streptomyces spiramenti]
MPIADKYLADDEDLVFYTRQHWTTLVTEFLLLLVVIAGTTALMWVVPSEEEWSDAGRWVILGVGVVAALWFWLIPLLQWRSTVYVLTTKRLHKRTGFITKAGRSIPLTRINDVSYSVGLWERIMRYGTLHVQSASEQGKMTLRHVPDPELLKTKVYQQIDAIGQDGPGYQV